MVHYFFKECVSTEQNVSSSIKLLLSILLFNPSEKYQNPLIKLTIWLIYVSA